MHRREHAFTQLCGRVGAPSQYIGKLPGKLQMACLNHGLRGAKERAGTIRMAGGEQLSVTGFQVIDEAKFNAMPDDVFADWRKKGWLALVYCQLLSTGSWATLIDQQADRSITSAGIADDTAAKETENAA